MSTPPFLRKLWEMVNDPGTHSVITWIEDGDGFKVLQPSELGSTILPKYFNGNLCSFVRQLNLYGFNKIGDEFAFKHYESLFIRGHEEKLSLIERRKNIKTRISNDTSATVQKKIKSKSVKSNEPKDKGDEKDYDSTAVTRLVYTSNAHDFMINWLTTELKHQQREITLLRQQISALTQFVTNSGHNLGNVPPNTYQNRIVLANETLNPSYVPQYPNNLNSHHLNQNNPEIIYQLSPDQQDNNNNIPTKNKNFYPVNKPMEYGLKDMTIEDSPEIQFLSPENEPETYPTQNSVDYSWNF